MFLAELQSAYILAKGGPQVPLCPPTVTGPEVKTEKRCRHLAAITHTSTFMQIITSLYLSKEANKLKTHKMYRL
jgi:hypothetical protein